jgi:hypothetical protein
MPRFKISYKFGPLLFFPPLSMLWQLAHFLKAFLPFAISPANAL